MTAAKAEAIEDRIAADRYRMAAEDSMARRRGQKGTWSRSKTEWRVCYWRHFTDGSKRYETSDSLGDRRGPNSIGIREANDLKAKFMDRINSQNRRPSSRMVIADFYASSFHPQVVEKKTAAGLKHYGWCWKKLEPQIGNTPLCDFTEDHVETVLAHYRGEGLAQQSLLHLKNAISAIFKHAKRKRLYEGENPASYVELPTPQHRNRPSYTLDQCRRILELCPSPVYEMVCLSIETSMGPSELKGLRRGSVNLGGEPRVLPDGIVLAPYSVLVKEGHYEGKPTGLKRPARQRILGITEPMCGALRELLHNAPDQSPEAPVFQSRNGTPVDTHNTANRLFKRIGKQLGFPVAWYGFRRAHSSAAGQVEGLAVEDRSRIMGHASPKMSIYYSIDDVERRRKVAEDIRQRLDGKVVEMSRRTG